MLLLCPICGSRLTQSEKSLFCENRHAFDIAKQGYVNLLPVQQKHSLHPGDTKEQVLSRRSFLDQGYYAPILTSVIDALKQLNITGPILDVGCGEGYYSANIADALNLELYGMDISRDAVRFAAARYKNAHWFCGTASHIPLPDQSIGILTSLFAITIPNEFSRVLKPDGLYAQVLAAEDHLLGLKSIIYPTLTHKEKDTIPELSGFSLIQSIPIKFSFTVENEMVQALLSMTPHVYRIGKEGAEKLVETKLLNDTASCVLNLYRKI